MDPRIPDALEAFPLRLDADANSGVEWLVDGVVIARTSGSRETLWPLARGEHVAQARVQHEDAWVETEPIPFLVK